MKNYYKVFPSSPRSANISTEVYNFPYSKYREVWQRARLKLKFRLIINKLVQTSIESKRRDTKGLKRLNARLPALTTCDTIPIFIIPWFIISPKNKALQYWNVFIALTLAYTSILMPIFLAFSSQDEHNIIDNLDRFLGFVYFFDFCVNCSTAFISKSGKTIATRSKILIHYAKSWMVIDFIAFFPFEILSSENKVINPLFKLARITRLYKVLKITKLVKWIKIQNNYGLMMKLQDIFGIRHTLLRMIFTFSYIMLCIHIISCIWCFSAKIQSYGPDTWVYRSGLVDNSNFDIYVTAVYWAFATLSTIGYGDVSANTNSERFISIIWMIFSLYFLGFTINTLSSFLNSIDSYDKILFHKLAIVDEFCQDCNLNKELRFKMRNAIRNSAAISKVSYSQKYDILSELPKDLKYEIATFMHRGIAQKFKFFLSSKEDLSIEVIPYLWPVHVNHYNFVYKKTEFPSEIFFILKGTVCFIDPSKNDNTLLFNDLKGFHQVTKKDYFGDIEVLMKIPRIYSTFCLENCELLGLSHQVMSKLKSSHPNIYFEIKGVAIERSKILSDTLKKSKELRRMMKFKTKSELSILRFKAFQRGKRDMEKSVVCKKTQKIGEVTKTQVRNKIYQLKDQLDSLLDVVDRMK